MSVGKTHFIVLMKNNKMTLNTSEHLLILAKVLDCKRSYESLSFPINFYNK